MSNQVNEFFNYCRQFYGIDGLYELNFSDDQIRSALLALFLDQSRAGMFCGDSFDRECVGMILQENFVGA